MKTAPAPLATVLSFLADTRRSLPDSDMTAPKLTPVPDAGLGSKMVYSRSPRAGMQRSSSASHRGRNGRADAPRESRDGRPVRPDRSQRSHVSRNMGQSFRIGRGRRRAPRATAGREPNWLAAPGRQG